MSWQRFERSRETLLHALAPPILSAVGNEDTPSPIFHGCFDWHSAVHGVYSLYAIHRRTGDALYLEAARQHVRPELVAAELEYMEGEELERQENPYGFAWVLALVRTQELVTGTRELRPLADYSAGRIAELVATLDDERTLELAVSDRHLNLSWALVHLDLWARYTADAGLRACACEGARRLLDPRLDDALPPAADAGDTQEFMPPSLMRLAALGVVLGDEARSAVRKRLPARFAVPPLEAPASGHAAGTNFFRAFALVQLYRATGLAKLRANAASLVRYQVARPDLWRAAGYDQRHWIAQIGVRVIDDSYDV